MPAGSGHLDDRDTQLILHVVFNLGQIEDATGLKLSRLDDQFLLYAAIQLDNFGA